MVQQLYMTNLKCVFLLSSVLDISSLKTKVKNVRVFSFYSFYNMKSKSKISFRFSLQTKFQGARKPIAIK